MSKKILVAKDTKLGNLNDYIKLISTLTEEFNLNAVAIKEINSDSRDMFVEFYEAFGAMELDYNYDYNELYINVDCNEKDMEMVNKIISRTKELVADKNDIQVTEKQREAINNILDIVKSK
ncbi:hypothetical protein [Paraclostridium tenue]|uniref:Uncharacterized protein n=1 Tax=Paraclostridium tenue TaxID=1737 RepID=A0ABN1MBD7_9FIRM